MRYSLLFLFALIQTAVFSQIRVTGKVTDEAKNPLPGANITIKGTTQGVVSDFDGNYEIQTKQGDVLEFSYVGFQTQLKNVMGGVNH